MTARRLHASQIDWWFATVTRIREERIQGNLAQQARRGRVALSVYQIEEARLAINGLRRRAA